MNLIQTLKKGYQILKQNNVDSYQLDAEILLSNTLKISKEELIEYINNSSGKPKIKQKARNELARRGVKLVWKVPSED